MAEIKTVCRHHLLSELAVGETAVILSAAKVKYEAGRNATSQNRHPFFTLSHLKPLSTSVHFSH